MPVSLPIAGDWEGWEHLETKRYVKVRPEPRAAEKRPRELAEESLEWEGLWFEVAVHCADCLFGGVEGSQKKVFQWE